MIINNGFKLIGGTYHGMRVEVEVNPQGDPLPELRLARRESYLAVARPTLDQAHPELVAAESEVYKATVVGCNASGRQWAYVFSTHE